MDVWNRHKESEIHDINEIGSGTKLLFTFLSLKVFRHEERERERETQSFYADCFYIISSRCRSAQICLASPSSECRLSRLEAGTQLSAFSQISAHASGACHHSHPLVAITIWDFYFDISEWHTRVNTCAHVAPN